jgi:hypothetical protein
MTKPVRATRPVTVFRSWAIRATRHTVRFDENNHLVLFPSFSRRSYHLMGDMSHMAGATGRNLVYGWLPVGSHVSGASRLGRVGHSDPQRPSTGSIWRPTSRTTWGSGFLSVFGQGRWSESDALGGACSTAQHQAQGDIKRFLCFF